MSEAPRPSIPAPPGSNSEPINERQSRRKRLRLSCGECRIRKLACDRNLPCQRCVRSGRPEKCSFEDSSRKPFVKKHQVDEQATLSNSEEVHNLRAEVAQLRAILSRSDPAPLPGFDGSSFATQTIPDGTGTALHVNSDTTIQITNTDTAKADKDISDPRQRSPTYYSQHTLPKFFHEIPQLFPFIKETSDEWLKPLGVHLGRPKYTKVDLESAKTTQIEAQMEDLLPSKEYTDELIAFYLDHVEKIHRIVHIPTFRREYAKFWIPGRPRQPAMTTLILSMLSICQGAGLTSANDGSQPGPPTTSVQWIASCEGWLRQQSSRHRKLIYYQIACLLYLARRMDIIRKKHYWKDTCSLIQDAISDGLHYEPSTRANSPYMCEMKRRMWATLRELDMQNCVEFGLPTLLHNIETTIRAPSNIDDGDFDDATQILPSSTGPDTYTDTSYQFHGALTWKLRLEISLRLSSPGCSKALTYDEVLQYTHQLTQALHAVPAWSDVQGRGGHQHSQLASAFLKFQLIELILAMHRPYLQKGGEKFWLSENIWFQMSRDILLLNTSLASLGSWRLVCLREDLLLGVLSVARITLLQPNDPNTIAMTQASATIETLEKCLPMFEDRYRRCPHEMWRFITMYSAILMIKIHLGKETWQTAKSACAQAFLAVYFKQPEREQLGPSILNEQESRQPNTSAEIASLSSEWLDSNDYDLFMDPFDLDVDVKAMYGSWNS
ncbi:hypothetical protein BKA64DRAFT_700132 [Cadophora sp. MPI-SDFR-AT-0126]|nr:hypothetical protein BKA64DRAFT_700132 [Leotiomycetes sp. MPI-SDFR-AT-0126]